MKGFINQILKTAADSSFNTTFIKAFYEFIYEFYLHIFYQVALLFKSIRSPLPIPY
jgi:hypothetical protein